MKWINRFFRMAYIQWILWRFGLDEFLLPSLYFFPFRVLGFFNIYRLTQRHLSRGERLRMALEKLGPIFVKAGQLLSTRRDFLPDDIADALSILQDRALPFSEKKVIKALNRIYGAQFQSIFADFSYEPLASASIAQVHAAILMNGEKVIVKLLRPNIEKQVEKDLDLLLTLATWSERLFKSMRTFKPVDIVKEIAETLHDELDLLREAANAEQLRRHFLNSSQLYVPAIFWEYSSHHALVQERIFATPIYDMIALKKSGFSLLEIAELCIQVFLTQVFNHSYFHGDLHPGNLFVRKYHGKAQLVAVDFGIMGSLNEHDKRYIAENMVAFFKRDYLRVAELHIACGWLSPDTRIDQFASAIRAVSEPIFARPLKDISFGQLLMRLFQVASRFQINIQPQLLLLQKSLLNIEGLSRLLAPELDLWKVATPYLENWLKKQIGIRSIAKQVRQQWSLWIEDAPKLPTLFYEVLKETKLNLEKKRFNTLGEKKKTPSKLNLKSFFLGASITLFCIAASQLAFPSIKNSEIFSILGLGFLCLSLLN